MIAGRYIEEDAVSASYGLAVDEFLMGYYSSPSNPEPPTLRLYTYRSNCVLAGSFQDVYREINIEECRRMGFEISRRPTGGGTILMGEDQLGIAFVMRGDNFKNIKNPREAFIHFSKCISEGLKSLGIGSAFRIKNDLTVNGRKIAGLGIYANEMDSWLFHASLLVDFDISLMLKLLKLPKEKLSERSIVALNERLTTVRRELGYNVSTKHVREYIKRGFEKNLGIKFISRPLNYSEIRKVKILEKRKYANPIWIFSGDHEPEKKEFIKKTDAGLVRVSIKIHNGLITSVKIYGDFFSNPSTLKGIEENIVGKEFTKEGLLRTISEEYDKNGWILGIDPETLASIIIEAGDHLLSLNNYYPSSCFIDQSVFEEFEMGNEDGK